VLLLVVALGLVFGIAHLLGSGGGGSGPAARQVGATASAAGSAPTAVVGARPTGLPGAVATKAGKARQTPTPTPLAVPTGPCANSDIVVTPSVRGQAYAGRPVRFAITLTTRTSPACTWDVTAGSLAVRLTSGSDRIWSTQDCVGAVPRQSVVVRRDHPVAVTVGWNGQRSDAECTRYTPWAEPGYYHVVAAAFGAEPTDVQFVLLPPPRPTITATPSPSASPSGPRSASPSGSPTAGH
jgi:hypothetical protein